MIILPKTSGQGVQVDTASPTYGWRDLEATEFPDPVGADAPQFSTFLTNIRAYSYGAADKMDMRFHIPHDWVPGTDLFIHHHWSHNGTAISGNAVINSWCTFAKRASEIFPAAKNQTMTYATVNIATTPRYIHRVDEVQLSSAGGSATLLDTSLIEVDGIILCGVIFTTIPTITGGAPNEPFLFRTDIHYQSSNIGTKAKAAPFYT
jgi:hypothetical protein